MFGTRWSGGVLAAIRDGDRLLRGFSGFGDEIPGCLLMVEAELFHGAEEAGVGFIVERNGHLTDDIDERKKPDLGIAAHALARGLGAEVGEFSGKV